MSLSPHHDAALSHVCGTSLFVDDRPQCQNELLIGVVMSPVAHGTISQIETTAAQAVPGVVRVFTAQDVPHNIWGPIKHDQPILASNTVSYIGEPIALVAATSPEALALGMAKISANIIAATPTLTIAQSRALQDFLTPAIHIKRGDCQQAFATSAHTLRGDFFNKGQDHFYLESQACYVEPGEQQDLLVHSSSQHPTEVQHLVAAVLGLKHHQVVCRVNRMGGAFGGKESQASHYAALCAVAAHHLRRPCRLALSKDDDMVATGKRHPFFTEWQVAFTATGIITGLKAELFSDGGAFLDLSTPIMQRALFHIDNAYFLENADLTGQICRTHTAPNTAFRGFGGPQGMMVIETIIEEIAQYLGTDSLTIRERNLYGGAERNRTPYGQEVTDHMLPELVAQLKETCCYNERQKQIAADNRRQRGTRRGLALTPVKFGISFTLKLLNQGNALVNLHLDGTLQVSTGATEMGQGVNTKIAIVVADALQIPINRVRVMATSTEKNHNTSATAASSGSDINGAAALNACNAIKARLGYFFAWYHSYEPSERPQPFTTTAEFPLDQTPDQGLPPGVVFADGKVSDASGHTMDLADLALLCYQFRVPLAAYGFHKTPDIHFDWQTGQGRPFLYYTCGAAASEVAIDTYTGETKVIRTDILMDLGRPINEAIDRGQVIGAFIQGMGWVTSEDLVYNDQGQLLTHSPTTYKIPNIQDIPRELHVALMPGRHNPLNIRGSKAVGEPPFLLAAAVFCAIKKALYPQASGGGQACTSRLNLPATAGEVMRVLQANHCP